MIQLSVNTNEASYSVDVFPPLVELGSWDFKKDCIRDLTLCFDIAMRDIFCSGEFDKVNKISFKKFYSGSRETFELNAGYDTLITKSENFDDIQKAMDRHVTALDAVLKRVTFSPRFQVAAYQAHANVANGHVKEYLDSMIPSGPTLPGELRNKGAVFIFDGPVSNSTLQIVLGESQVVPGGLFCGIQYSFPGSTETYKSLIKTVVDYSTEQVFPGLGIKMIG